MATKRDYYEILGIERNASEAKIKRAFRKLAFAYHPDRNHEDGAEERFKEVNEAYEVLSDPDRRATYDRFGHGGTEGLFGQGFEGFDFSGFGDIFDAFFGGRTTTARQAPQRGADLHQRVTIAFEEAAFGVEKEITVSRTERCTMCHGTGHPPDSYPTECPTCNGHGQIRRVQQNIFGRFTNITTCPRCHGEGSIISQPCSQCHGTGMKRSHRSITVEIPAGVDNHSQICVSGEGNAGMKGGASGDLYLSISVKESELFKRDGDNVLYELPVNFTQAALGTELEVPTLDGTTKLKIPAGSQTGQVFRLKKKGIPHLYQNGRGDQLVQLRIVTPSSLTKKQRELFEELGKTFIPPEKTR